MTRDEAEAVLATVTYRPGWDLELQERHEGLLLRITATVPDSYHPEATIDLGIDTYLPPCTLRDRESFLEFLAWRLERVESHESREWFKVDGKPYRDPHADDNRV